MAVYKGKEINVFSVHSKMSDINISIGAIRLLEHWGINTIGELYIKGNLYLDKYRNFGLIKIDEICLIRDFLDYLIYLDFPFENCVEHDFVIPMCQNCMINRMHLNMPLSQLLDLCYSPFCALTLAELVETKRSKKHSMLELIEINLILNKVSERYKCDILQSEDIDTYGNRFHSQNGLEDSLHNALSELHENQREVLLHRYGIGEYEGKTLEQIGKIYNLTRERIRQIESKALRKFTDKTRKDRRKIFSSIEPIYFRNQHNIVDLIIDIAVSESIFQNLKDYSDIYVRSELISDLEADLNKINQLVLSNGSYCFDGYVGLFETYTLFKILSLNYKVQDNTIYGKNTLTSAIRIMMSNLEGGLSFGSEENINQIIQSLNDDFGIDKKEEVLRTCENVLIRFGVQVGPRHYKDPRFVIRLSADLLKRIYDRVFEFKTASAKELFGVFRKELTDYKIDNPTGLYGYLRFFHSEMYSFGGMNLVISLLGEKTSWQEVIKEIIQEKGKPVFISEIQQKHPDISSVIINNSIVNDPEILFWGNGKLFLSSMIKISRSERIAIWNFVQEEKVIRTSKLLYFIIENFPGIQEDNSLENEESMVQFLKNVYPDMFDYKDKGTMIYFLE